jgi:hypothetical protein
MPPNKIPVLFVFPSEIRSGWREGKKFFVLSGGAPVEVCAPIAWSAIGDGKGTDCEIKRISL